MQTSCRTPFTLVTNWCLLTVWLFFGSLALAEQMNLLSETSTQDEHALWQLASALKTDVPPHAGGLSPSVAPEASALSSLTATDAIYQVRCTTVRNLPALRLHQRLSVYRI